MGTLFQTIKPAALPKSASAGETTVSPNTNTSAELSKAIGKVTIICGACEVSYPVAGKTVAFVRKALGGIVNAPGDAQALIDGQTVTSEENAVLTDNSVLEFIRPNGSKGSPLSQM